MTEPLFITPEAVTFLRPVSNPRARRALESLAHGLEDDHPRLSEALCATLRESLPEAPKAGGFFDARSFGRKVRERRESEGLSRRQIAEATGLNHSTIYRVEQGAIAELETMCRLCRWLGAELSDFWEEES